MIHIKKVHGVKHYPSDHVEDPDTYEAVWKFHSLSQPALTKALTELDWAPTLSTEVIQLYGPNQPVTPIIYFFREIHSFKTICGYWGSFYHVDVEPCRFKCATGSTNMYRDAAVKIDMSPFQNHCFDLEIENFPFKKQ